MKFSMMSILREKHEEKKFQYKNYGKCKMKTQKQISTFVKLSYLLFLTGLNLLKPPALITQ